MSQGLTRPDGVSLPQHVQQLAMFTLISLPPLFRQTSLFEHAPFTVSTSVIHQLENTCDDAVVCSQSNRLMEAAVPNLKFLVACGCLGMVTTRTHPIEVTNSSIADYQFYDCRLQDKPRLHQFSGTGLLAHSSCCLLLRR